jgi:hypothetical protein
MTKALGSLFKRALKNVQFCSRSRKTKILTTGIHIVFRGLNFESDAEIGQKGMFFKALFKRSLSEEKVPGL